MNTTPKLTHLPVKSEEADFLFFNETGKQIAQFVNNYDGREPYAYAIFGDWGVGKSTLLNFIERHIDLTRCKVVRFNPWNLINHIAIIESLFEEIASVVKKETKVLKTLKGYGEKIFHPIVKGACKGSLAGMGVDDVSSSATSEAVANLTEAIVFSGDPLSTRRKDLFHALSEWAEKGNKVIVFIDELDRLLPDEMINIFKLIKAYLDFPGIFFIVGVDKQSAYDALEFANIKNKELYIDKIFQSSHTIVTDYQVQMLTEKLLLPVVHSLVTNKKDLLIRLIPLYFYVGRGAFVEEFTINRTNRIIESLFNNIFSALRTRIINTRSFVKFTEYIVLNWDKYINSLEVSDKSQQHIAFVLFILHFFEQGLVVSSVIMNQARIEKSGEGLLKSIAQFVRAIGAIKSGNRVSYDKVIYDAMFALNSCKHFQR